MLIGPQSLLVARYMDLLVMRQKVVATNIANADTPGYRARDIDFRAEMARAIDNPEAKPLPPISVQHVEGLAVGNDGNNVSLDRELQTLAGNAIRYTVAAQMLRRNIQSLRSAIQEGAR